MRYVGFDVCIYDLVLYEITRWIAILVDALLGKRNLPIANRQVCLHNLSEHIGKCLFLCTEENKTRSKPIIILMAVLWSFDMKKFETWTSGMCYRHYGQYMEIIFIYIDMILTLLLYVGKVRGTMTSCAKKSGWIEKTHVTKQHIKSVLPLCRAIWSWTVTLGIPNRLLQELIQAFSLPSLQLVFVNTFLLIH